MKETPQEQAVSENDDWVTEFNKRAGPRLQKVLEDDLEWIPSKEILERLERLRRVEQQLLKKLGD